MASSSIIDTDKAALRATALARRDALLADERKAAADTIAQRAFPIAIQRGVIVSGFFPMKSEISPLPLLRRLAEQGAQLALPVVAARGQPLTMRAWKFDDELGSGQWGIREPRPEAPQVEPDILIVPLACFDRAGHRIGYGAGYYDMTIRRLRGIKSVAAIGIAFAAQEIEKVPATERDEALDLVLTENEVIDLRKR